MSELRKIAESFDAAVRRGERCALATVVSVEGSSYRRPGARMLVREDGSSAGSISAGCLERDVVEHARRVMRTGVRELLEYETASTDNELAWGLGIGCGGTVRVLIDAPRADCAYLAALRRAAGESPDDASEVVVTVYDAGARAGRRSSSEGVEVGARLFVDAAGVVTYEGMSGDVAAVLVREAVSAWQGGAAARRVETGRGASLGVLVEELARPVPIVIFGAGPDVVPLVQLAREAGWHTEVVDPQANPTSQLRLRMADRVTLARPEHVAERVTITSRTMAVLMTHNYVTDLALLDFLLASPARYVGVMGPGHRTQRMLLELAAGDARRALARSDLAQLHAPIGLDIGGEGPFEIALSIVAEIRAVLSGRRGAMLRDHDGRIHGRPEEAREARDGRVPDLQEMRMAG